MLKKQYYLSKAFILFAITVALALGATALVGVFKATFLVTFSHWLYTCSGLIFSITIITIFVRPKSIVDSSIFGLILLFHINLKGNYLKQDSTLRKRDITSRLK